MVCTANDILQGWKDFPKGLKVVLLYEDINSAAEMKSRLQQMDYVVTVFCNEDEALSALSSKSQTYHIAIVEVSSSNNDGIFRFLETAKDLPSIMTSNIHCLSTMMKCIALGAVEFLQTPLSDDKLRNIWQHVAHKAFNDNREKKVCELLETVDELGASVQQSIDREVDAFNLIVKSEDSTAAQENFNSPSGDKYPAPSTPQLKQGARLLDHGDCQDQTEDSKSVDTICCNSATENACFTSSKQQLEEVGVKEEHQSADKSDTIVSHSSQSIDPPSHPCTSGVDLIKSPRLPNSSGSKSNRKKIKVEWTNELHKKFIHAVEQLGVDQAIPSRILELMKVEGLTRHNVASHLQKYRMQRRHILPKQEERRWPNPRDSRKSYYPYKPIMSYPPPYHPNHPVAPANHQGYPAWLPPASSHTNGVPMWGSHYYPPWQPAENWHWGPYSGMHADAWGCPVIPPGQPSFTPYHQNAYDYRGSHALHARGNMVHHLDLHPAEETIDKVVKEAISKPYLPLPLGLKPPSTESVVNELSKQGIHLHHSSSHPKM